MKKVLSYIASIAMVLSLLMYPNYEVQAANVSLGVSASTVNIGDSVTVSVTVPDSITATIDLTFSTDVLSFSSASADVGTNGGVVTMNVGKYSVAGSSTMSVTFKAKTSGTATISAGVVSAVDNETAEETSLDGASTTITVENQTTAPTPDPTPEQTPTDNPADEPVNDPVVETPTDTTTQQSGDNSLASLKLSSGTLSPEFKYNVTNYTATVGYNVTSVIVSATASNAKATIESVTGNGTVPLEVGENTIQVVVKAENGVKATYTIIVTRQPQEEGVTPEEETPVTPSNQVFQWNGQVLEPTESIPAETIPADFQQTTVEMNEVEVPALTFANGNLKLLYLTGEDGNAGLYVYDEVQQSVYPFVKIGSEAGYVMVLLPDEANAPAPEGYQACTLSIDGKGVIRAYQFVQQTQEETTGWLGAENYYAAEPVISDFYLIYCMNHTGETGWYVYDSVEQTYQRYLGSVHTSVVDTTDVETSADVEATDDETLAGELETVENIQTILLVISVVVNVILIIIIVVMILRRREEEYDEYDDDDYDEDEYESKELEDTTVKEAVDEDDEIEIEFYEMPQAVSEEVVEDDDDEIEIEFYEMPQTVTEEIVEEKKADFIDMEALLLQETAASEKTAASAKVTTPVKEKPVAPVVQKKQTVVEEDDDDGLEFIELD